MPQFGLPEFAPDAAGFDAQVCNVADGVLAISGGYGPFPGFMDSANDEFPELCLGAIEVTLPDGTRAIFAGSEEKLYRLDTDGTWLDLSTGTYAAGNGWVFELYGNNLTAWNGNDDPQVVDVTTANDFVDLGGNPPNGAVADTYRDYLFTYDKNIVYWSGTDDITAWTPGVDNSGFQGLPDNGPIKGLIAGEAVLVFQQQKIHRFLQGSDFGFTRDEILQGIGLVGKRALASGGGRVFFLSEDGFKAVNYAGGLTDIGAERIDRYFANLISPNEIENVVLRTDAKKPLVYASFKSSNYSNDGFNKLIIYNWQLDRWTTCSFEHQFMVASSTPALTLEDLGSIYGNIEDVPGYIDGPAYRGGALRMGAIDVDGTFGYFQGQPMAAQIESAPYLIDADHRKTVGGIRLIGDVSTTPDPNLANPNFTLRAGLQEDLGGPIAWTNQTPPNATGKVPFRNAGRVVRARIDIEQNVNWTRLQGINVDLQANGVR